MSNNETLIYSFYGALFDGEPGGFSLKALTAFLGALGLSPEASRLALSRMARAGFLRTKRKGRSSFYFLSDEGLRVMRRGEGRSVFRGETAPWDGKFRLVSYEFPETEREARNALSEALRIAGFGRVAAGTWAYPFDLSPPAEAALAAAAPRGTVETFTATHEGDSRAFTSRVWKLDERSRDLRAFAREYSGRRERYRDAPPGSITDGAWFALYFSLLGDFVRTMACVPPVPTELLPDDWPAAEARETFVSCRALARPGTSRFVDSVSEPFEE